MDDDRVGQRIDPTTEGMIQELLNLGNLTVEEVSYCNRLFEVREKGLALFSWEKQRLHRIYDERTK